MGDGVAGRVRASGTRRHDTRPSPARPRGERMRDACAGERFDAEGSGDRTDVRNTGGRPRRPPGRGADVRPGLAGRAAGSFRRTMDGHCDRGGRRARRTAMHRRATQPRRGDRTVATGGAGRAPSGPAQPVVHVCPFHPAPAGAEGAWLVQRHRRRRAPSAPAGAVGSSDWMCDAARVPRVAPADGVGRVRLRGGTRGYNPVAPAGTATGGTPRITVAMTATPRTRTSPSPSVTPTHRARPGTVARTPSCGRVP